MAVHCCIFFLPVHVLVVAFLLQSFIIDDGKGKENVN